MKISIDIDRLLNNGKITKNEYERLVQIYKQEQKTHFGKILYVLGLIAISIGIINLAPTFFIDLWRHLKVSLSVPGLLFAMSVISLLGAVRGKSGFFSGVSCLLLISLFNHLAFHTTFKDDLDVLNTIICSGIAMFSFAISNELEGELERVAIVYSRVALFCANFAFWFTSVFGNTDAKRQSFAIFWGIGLLTLGYWGASQGRRFVVNTCATFGSIHFFTQYFKIVGYSPGALIIAGIIAVLISSLILRYNKNFRTTV